MSDQNDFYRKKIEENVIERLQAENKRLKEILDQFNPNWFWNEQDENKNPLTFEVESISKEKLIFGTIGNLFVVKTLNDRNALNVKIGDIVSVEENCISYIYSHDSEWVKICNNGFSENQIKKSNPHHAQPGNAAR